MLIVGSLLQAGLKRSHVLYLAWALLGLMVVHRSWAAVDPPNPKDLTQGTWEVDVAKSKYCGGQSQGEAALKASRREIIDAGYGLISVHWTGTRADGQPFDTRYVYRYDGQKYPASIMQPDANESITWKLVSPNRVEFTHWSKENKVTQRLVRTVSNDGQVMTQTTRYASQTGCDEVQVFNRAPDAPRRPLGAGARPRADGQAPATQTPR